MANQNGRPIAPARKLIAVVLGTIAAFVVVYGIGLASWAIVVLGLVMLALAIVLAMVNVARRGARAWVAGNAQVKAVSDPPVSSRYGRAELQLVIVAPGLPVTEVLAREPRVPVEKWPRPGGTLPVQVDVDDMRRVRIDWATAPDNIEPPPPGHSYDAYPDAHEEFDDDLLGEPEPPPWATSGRDWGRDPDEPPPPPPPGPIVDHGPMADPRNTPVIVHDTPGGAVVEGQLVDQPQPGPLPRRAPRSGPIPSPSPPSDPPEEPESPITRQPGSRPSPHPRRPAPGPAAEAAGMAAATATVDREEDQETSGGTQHGSTEATAGPTQTDSPPSQRRNEQPTPEAPSTPAAQSAPADSPSASAAAPSASPTAPSASPTASSASAGSFADQAGASFAPAASESTTAAESARADEPEPEPAAGGRSIEIPLDDFVRPAAAGAYAIRPETAPQPETHTEPQPSAASPIGPEPPTSPTADPGPAAGTVGAASAPAAEPHDPELDLALDGDPEPPPESGPDAKPSVAAGIMAPPGEEVPGHAVGPSHWGDLEGGYDPDERTNDVITAYPSARPGPAGAIHGVGIQVLVTDLDRSVAFYQDVLGFFAIDGGPGSAVLASGDTRVVLRRVHELSPDSARVVYLNLEVGDIDATYEELQSKGVEFVHGPRLVNRGERLELWSATFMDPDHHNIAISQWRAAR